MKMNKEPYYNTLPQDAKDWLDEHREEIDQDYVGQRELPIPDIALIPVENVVPEESIYFTKMEKSVLTLLGRGLDRRDTCEILEISRLTLRQHLFNMKQKLNDFNHR